MKAKYSSLLLHPLFLISLALLLLNDFYLKYALHNGFTGKLSDFAGLFAFGVFFVAFFPKYKLSILIACALFFLWWKSPLSNAFIDFLNIQWNWPVQRVVDYSDDSALFVLPLAFYIKPTSYSRSFIRQIAIALTGIVSFFSFTATSMIRKIADDNKVLLNKSVTTEKKEAEIIKALQDHRLNPQPDSAIYQKLREEDFYIKSKDKEGKTVMIRVDSLHIGVYKRIDYGSCYSIPKMYAAGDSISNLELIIAPYNKRKTEVWLYSFEYKVPDSSRFDAWSYPLYRKFKKPIKKQFKRILR